ncbi:MAG: DUF2950 domain-containing protein [Rubrivivax sp.]
MHNVPHIPALRGAGRLNAALAVALAALLSGAPAVAAPPQKAAAAPAQAAPQRMHFAAPEAAVNALLDAMRKDDVAALQRILGPGSVNIVNSGDAAADDEARNKFVAAFDERHAIDVADGRATLVVGRSDWPMPVPLVKRTQGWTFDARAGATEIVARRIGRNELDAIQVCLAFVDMEREYAEADHDGNGLLEYTPRLLSRPGRHDGLYWPTQPGEPPSPAGPRLAAASPQALAAHEPGAPYHGYYFRVLSGQGPHAPGGARSWRIDGKLIGGVALVAWPARYRVSGVKTFQCAMDGIVHERDLGPDTAAKVERIEVFDPGPGWSPVK